MKRKVLFTGVSALLLSLAFTACKKESQAEPATAPLSDLPTQQRVLVVDFNYKLYFLTNNDGSKDYKCLSPKDDCSKIKSQKTSTRDAQEAALDAAIANHETRTFFQTESNWDELLPILIDQTDWLELLTEDVVWLAKKTDVVDHGMLYIAYDPSVDPDSIKEGDTSFAIGITDHEE